MAFNSHGAFFMKLNFSYQLFFTAVAFAILVATLLVSQGGFN